MGDAVANSFTRTTCARLAGLALAVAVVAAGAPVQAAPPPSAGHDHASHDHAAAEGAGQPHGDGGLGAHGESEGLKLVAASGESVVGDAPRCGAGAPERAYDVVAMAAEVTLNRYLDHDPEGRLYALAGDVDRVRDEVARNARARAGAGEPAVSVGLQGDAIQPLTLRTRPGECLRISLRNDLPGEPASLHLHGAGLKVARTGEAAIATNPDATAAPGETVAYEWLVPADQPEATHYFHSHGDERRQTSHGLFGAVVVEPPGATWTDPLTGSELATGWSAVVTEADGRAFREFALYYHEIGHENFQIRNGAGELVPLVDPVLSSYRPGSRAINYRSEPFMNRLSLQQSRMGLADESLSYSSYTFGDPATPIARAYLGDRTKQRVIHGGSEVFHVHHVHGGSIRWRRQPGTEDDVTEGGLQKRPPLLPEASERIDSQGIGPSETFDVENECGAGGCQQSPGDYLVHCHVAQHYFAGMWAVWRVYNTTQDGASSTDGLPPLLELPHRKGAVAPAVTSDRLIGTTVDSYGQRTAIGAADLGPWVERQLPPPGVPRGYDASVLDWQRQGDRYLNEPETDQEWPGYRPRAPGTRPPLLFDPKTGKLAYPFLRPHFGKRPPFPPDHNPSPYLDPVPDGRSTPQPGANGPGSVCPAGTRLKRFGLNAIALPITLNERENLVDAAGEIFVLTEEEAAVREDNDMRRPLAIRANAGEDCVDITLRSELEDSPLNKGFAKVNAHIHFMQFDVQASDGVITGFNFEQSVRPYAIEGEQLAAPAPAGASTVRLVDAARFQPGVLVGVGMEDEGGFEVRRITAVQGTTVVLDAPLDRAHAAGRTVSTEWVRYRWYPDVQFGTAYFHDHVNALASWRHGLYGAVISEPPGSTYHDPHTGSELRSGPLADIRTPPGAPVTADVTGSFREAVLFIQDDAPITAVGRSSGSAINLRVEPLDDRADDPSMAFSSQARGDPATPLLEAYLGDPVVLRTLVAGTNDVHTLHVDGHWFRTEPFSTSSPPVNAAHLGISERVDLAIPAAGGPQRRPGDYLYYNGRSFKLEEGSWGILRVHDGDGGAGLQRLPGREAVPAAAPSVCPAGSPERRFDVHAVEAPLPMLGGKAGKIFVLAADRAGVLDGSVRPEPLVLRVAVGDCIVVDLTNGTTGGPVSLHPDMLSFDPATSAGVAAGREPAQAVAPGATRTVTWFASPEVGPTTAMLRDWGDVLRNPALGLFGAVVVAPAGSRFVDPTTGEDLAGRSSWDALVVPPAGDAYRDFAVFLQDEDAGIGTHRMPYSESVSGVVGVNYRTAPVRPRLSAGADPSRVHDAAVHGDPATPLIEAMVGDPVAVHVLSPWSEQAQVFSLEGHEWELEPGRAGSDRVSSLHLGGTETLSLSPLGGAGGRAGLPGDYLYGNHRLPYAEAGMWGLFRVRCPADSALTPLPGLDRAAGACGPGSAAGAAAGDGGTWAAALGTGAGLLLLAAAVAWRRRHPPGAPGELGAISRAGARDPRTGTPTATSP